MKPESLQSMELFSSLWRDIIAIAGLAVGALSIIISILIFRITSKTSQKVLEESVKRAFKTINKSDKSGEILIQLEKEQVIKLRRSLNKFIKNRRCASAIELVILLEDFMSEEQAIQIIYYWQEKGYITWNGNLENMTIITFVNIEKINESINT